MVISGEKWGLVLELFLLVVVQSMFMGEYHPTLDEKGRVAIPVKLRKAFGENDPVNTLVLTTGSTSASWRSGKRTGRNSSRRSWFPCPVESHEPELDAPSHGRRAGPELDKQGRIMIPADHLEYARDKERHHDTGT